MFADIQVSGGVVGHAVTFIAGSANFFDAILGAPPAAHITGHVAEIQALLFRIPNRTFGEPKTRTKFFDSRTLIDQLEHLRRFRFDGVRGIAHSVFRASSISKLTRRPDALSADSAHIAFLTLSLRRTICLEQ